MVQNRQLYILAQEKVNYVYLKMESILLNVQPVKQRYPAILPTYYKRLLLIPLNLRVGKQLHLLI